MKGVNYLLFVILVLTLSVITVLPNVERIWADEVIGTVSVGDAPYGLEYNPSNEDIYVTNRDSDDVSVIDSSTNTVVATVDVGDAPYYLEYNPSNEDVYVANKDSGDVSVIDSSTNTVVATVDVGDAPSILEYNPSNENMYVTNQGSDDVSVIDSSTNTVVATVDVGDDPYALEYNPSNENIYVANANIEEVSVIDSSTNTVVATVDVGSSPNDLEYNPSNEDIYVANIYSDNVSIISGLIKPTANAGPDQTVNQRDTVQLDGSGSSDPSGGTLTYQWTQTQGPEVTLSDSTSVNPTFTAPNTNLEEDLVFELVVTNGKDVVSEPDSVTITVTPSSNSPPPLEGIVDSGNNINIQVQENSGNNVGGQSDFGGTYSDSPIYQEQSTGQNSNVAS